MTGRLAHIWRHPIKSHGREELRFVDLTAGKTLPWDRAWAIYHDAAKIDLDNPQWAHCANFSRGAKSPELMAINAQFNDQTCRLTLSHPKQADLSVNPDRPADQLRLIEWVRPLVDPNRGQPKGVIRVPERGMTDTDYASISINNLNTLTDLSTVAGQNLQMQRWRGNLWLDGFKAWSEFDWIGKTIKLGEVEIAIREPIGRCLATTANTTTGKRDVDTLKILQTNWGHKNFGVHGEVIKGGTLTVGDTIGF